ncbi:hypothetical protein D9599_19260 [Roseomonas sp. KE2513]|nr:hypothetical protein [Roseomonas sp. KE2513]
MSLPAAMAAAGAAMAASAMASGLNAAAELSQNLTGDGSNSDADESRKDELPTREADVAPSPESSNDLA